MAQLAKARGGSLTVWVLWCCLLRPVASSLHRHDSATREDFEYSIIVENCHLQDGTWENITYDGFEGGWGNFVSGGKDAKIETGTAYAKEGEGSLCISDNDGAKSSAFHKDDHDVTPCSGLRIQFWFLPRKMDGDEDFFLEYSADGGSTYVTVMQYVRGREFENGNFYFSKVNMNEADFDLQTSQARIRFRCDASGNKDYVYIDEVVFQGLILEENEPFVPSQIPSLYPSDFPSQWPSASPSAGPSKAPSDDSPTFQSPSFLPSNLPSEWPSDPPSSQPSGMPSLSSFPSSFPTMPLTRDDICPRDRVNPPEKYEILPYTDTISSDNVEDDLNEISYIAFSEQKESSTGIGYAYVASDKEQFSLKVVRISDNVFGQHFNGIGDVVMMLNLNVPFQNDDWESISLGPCTDSDGSVYMADQTCIYVRNTGNNVRGPNSPYVQREVLKVFKFVEPVIKATSPPQSFPIDVAAIEFRYGNFTQTLYDCEYRDKVLSICFLPSSSYILPVLYI